MKSLLLLLIASSFLSSCDFIEKDQFSQYLKIKEEERNFGIRNDTIFLGYVLGMTPDEFKAKTEDLVNSEKVSQVESGLFYTLNASHQINPSFKASIKPEYFRDSLYQLILTFENTSYKTTSVDRFEIIDFVENQYGAHDVAYVKAEGLDEEYFWINGNQQIHLHYFRGNVNLIYLDTQREFEMKKKQSRKENEPIKRNSES